MHQLSTLRYYRGLRGACTIHSYKRPIDVVFVPWKFSVHVDIKRSAGTKGDGSNLLWVGTQTRPDQTTIPTTSTHYGDKDGFSGRWGDERNYRPITIQRLKLADKLGRCMHDGR